MDFLYIILIINIISINFNYIKKRASKINNFQVILFDWSLIFKS